VTAGSDRLERSRLAILEHLHRKEQRRQGRNANSGNAHGNANDNGPRQADEGMWESHRRAHRPGAGGWFETARDVLQD
jgi:hypothetical protein